MKNDIENIDIANKIEYKKVEVLSVKNFIVLKIMSLGGYSFWWVYKCWVFFRCKDNLDITPPK